MLPEMPIDLLVFSAGGLRFGAYARQVAEVVPVRERDPRAEEGFFPCEHNGETFQGIDFRHWLNQYMLPKHADCGSEGARPSKLLLIAPSRKCPYRAVRINEVEEFLTAAFDDVFTLPMFAQKLCRCSSALWGVARHEDAFVLLIDLFELQWPGV